MICRMCLQCNDLVDIFHDELMANDLHEKVRKYLHQDIKKEDNMPKYICLHCVKKILNFDLFCVQVAQNQEFFQEHFEIDIPIVKGESVDINTDSDDNEIEIVDELFSEDSSDMISEEQEIHPIQEKNIGNEENLFSEYRTLIEIEPILNEDINDEENLFSEYFTTIEQIEYEHDYMKKESKTEITKTKVENDTYEHTTKNKKLVPSTKTDLLPRTIMKDGRFIMGRKNLLELASRFYTLKCELCAAVNLNKIFYGTISRLFFHYKNVHSVSGYVTCCNIKLANRSAFILHMVKHLQPDAFKCSICGKKASNPSCLQAHMKCHTTLSESSKEIRCEECGIKFNSLHFLEIHKNKIHTEFSQISTDKDITEPHKDFPGFPRTIIKNGEVAIRGKPLGELLAKFYKLTCDLCADNEIFPDISLLFSHYNDVHSIKGYIRCCGNKFQSRTSVTLHMARHLDPEAFKCIECGKMTSTLSRLKDHMETHKPKEEQAYFCTECPKRYSSHTGLEKHLISHIPEEQRVKHVCNKCGKIFFSSGALQTHLRYTHLDQKLVCDQCGRLCKNKPILTRHMASHNKSKSKMFRRGRGKGKPKLSNSTVPFETDCTTCGQSFEDRSSFLSHMSEVHDIMHKCKVCNYTTKRWQLLDRHMTVQHGEKKFSCDRCGRSFRYSFLLRDHIQVHTGMRVYGCEFCGRKYASVSGLCRHRRDMHALEYEDLKEKNREIRKNKKTSEDNIEI